MMQIHKLLSKELSNRLSQIYNTVIGQQRHKIPDNSLFIFYFIKHELPFTTLIQ